MDTISPTISQKSGLACEYIKILNLLNPALYIKGTVSRDFRQIISSPTPRYASQREIQLKIFLSTPRYAAQRKSTQRYTA
jgi:hypothetical protein